MSFSCSNRGLALVAGLLLAAPALQAQAAAPAAIDIQKLLATAEHNTNTVHSLIHQDTQLIKSKNTRVTVSARGAEDEVRNREQDHESVLATGKTTTGVSRKVQYTLDLVFMNNKTYYRSSLAQNAWKSRAGMSFADPFVGGWKRGRTAISFKKSVSFHLVDTSGGLTHLQAPFTSTRTAGTVDLWISGGSKPYVVRELQNYHSTSGPVGSVRFDMHLGPFNSAVVIEPPTGQATT